MSMLRWITVIDGNLCVLIYMSCFQVWFVRHSGKGEKEEEWKEREKGKKTQGEEIGITILTPATLISAKFYFLINIINFSAILVL